MNLSFRTHWSKTMPAHLAGKPTYFVEKIIKGLKIYRNPINTLLNSYAENIKIDEYLSIEKFESLTPKLHTIRQDLKDRWQASNDIHFIINARTKDRFQFAPIIPCISTQTIEIMYPPMARFPVILIDGKRISKAAELTLADNDGFNCYADFTAWFNKDCTSKIIHWTDFKY